MWEFSNLNTGSIYCLHDAAQSQNSIAFPTDTSYSCSFKGLPFPDFGVQRSFFHHASTFLPPLNTPEANPAINTFEPEAKKTKRFLVFHHSGNQTSLVFSSFANPYEGLVPTLPTSIDTQVYASNNAIAEEDEVHEDSEEIDALLYSDSENFYDNEEGSSRTLPSETMDDEIASSYIPAKRRRVDSSKMDVPLMDTAGSATSPSSYYIFDDDGGHDLSFDGCNNGRGKGKNSLNKRERIRTRMSKLRRIIPGGNVKGKDTASVLHEAVQHLKSLKLRAKAAGADSFSL